MKSKDFQRRIPSFVAPNLSFNHFFKPTYGLFSDHQKVQEKTKEKQRALCLKRFFFCHWSLDSSDICLDLIIKMTQVRVRVFVCVYVGVSKMIAHMLTHEREEAV